MRKSLAILAILVGSLFLFGSLASGSQADHNPGVCTGTHIKPPTETTTEITVTAPEGQLISGYCVKAGSIKQDLGPEYVTLDPPVKTVTIAHSSGKDISHYTVTFVTEGSTDGTDGSTDTDGTDTDGSTDLGTDSTTDGGTDTVIGDGGTITRERGFTPSSRDQLPVTGWSNLAGMVAGLTLIAVGFVIVKRYG